MKYMLKNQHKCFTGIFFLLLHTLVFGQIRTTDTPSLIRLNPNSSAFIDASSVSYFNNSTNLSKGLLFPRTDLTTFSSFEGILTSTSHPTRFDGMVVYNTGLGLTLASASNTVVSVEPGFYYYDNKSSDVKGGTWRPLAGSVDLPAGIGDNIYNSDGDISGDRVVGISNTLNFANRLFYINATNNRVGVCTSNPLMTFSVEGSTLLGYNIVSETSSSIKTKITNIVSPTQITSSTSATPETALRLIRSGKSGQKWSPTADFQIGSFTNNISANTSLNIRLGNGNTNTPNTDVMTLLSNGNVGVGTTAPRAKLMVAGAAVNDGVNNEGGSSVIDFSVRNLATTTASNGSNFTLQNIQSGGTYTLTVKSTTQGKASFSASGFTFYSPNLGQTSGDRTIYTFVVMDSDVYVYMTTNIKPI